MKKLIAVLLFPVLAVAQPPPITTLPLTVTSAIPHAVGPTGFTDGIIPDAMTSINAIRGVEYVATTNTTLSGVQTIDGMSTASTFAPVLLTGQTTTSENGPWATNDSGAWTRPDWYKNGSTTQAQQDQPIFVRAGLTKNGSVWTLNQTGAITIGTTGTSWLVRPINAATLNGTLAIGRFPTAAAHTVLGNFTGSAAAPSFNALGTGVDTFLVTPSASNLRSAIASGAVTGTAGNLVFSASPTLTGLTLVNGNIQIGAGTTSPQPLVAILGTPVAFTAKIGNSGSYAQFALKDDTDAQRGFIGYIGSTFSNPLRRDHFEFGTAAGVPIHFRPGDGDGVGFSMDERSVLHIANVATSTGTKLIAFPATSQPAPIPSGSPACGQLYMSSTGQLSFLTPTGTPYAITP